MKTYAKVSYKKTITATKTLYINKKQTVTIVTSIILREKVTLPTFPKTKTHTDTSQYYKQKHHAYLASCDVEAESLTVTLNRFERTKSANLSMTFWIS